MDIICWKNDVSTCKKLVGSLEACLSQFSKEIVNMNDKNSELQSQIKDVTKERDEFHANLLEVIKERDNLQQKFDSVKMLFS